MENKYAEYVFTERLKEERYLKRLSAAKMVAYIGKLSPVSYINIENGFVQPKISDMNKIAEALGKPVDYFFKLELQGS